MIATVMAEEKAVSDVHVTDYSFWMIATVMAEEKAVSDVHVMIATVIAEEKAVSDVHVTDYLFLMTTAGILLQQSWKRIYLFWKFV